MSFKIQIFSVLSTMLEAPFVFLSEKSWEEEALPESRQTFELRQPKLLDKRVNLVFSRQSGFLECEHQFIDKSMIITEPTVLARSWSRAIRPGFQTMLRMLNKDAESFSSSPKLSKQKKRSADRTPC